MPDRTKVLKSLTKVVLKEFTCTIDICFGRSYMAESEEEFVAMVQEDFYEEYGIKLGKSEITNIKEKK